MAEEDKGPKNGKRAKDQHANHARYERGLSDDMKSFLSQLYSVQEGKFEGIRLTSGLRQKKEGQKHSHHHTGDAVDIAARGEGGVLGQELYEYLLNTEEGLNLMDAYGLGIIDETDPETMKKYGSTGPHFHIGKDPYYSNITKDRIGQFASGNLILVKSYYSQHSDFDYSNTQQSYDNLVTNISSPEPFNIMYGEAERSFIQDVKNEQKKSDDKEEKISKSDARKEIEKKKQEKRQAEAKRKSAFIDALTKINAPEKAPKPRKEPQYKESRFTPILPDAKMGALPSIFRLPNFDEGGTKNGDEKDQWGRPAGSKWFGFDPEKKVWTKGRPNQNFAFNKEVVPIDGEGNKKQFERQPRLLTQQADFEPEVYYYKNRIGSEYRKDNEGKWYISNKSTKGEYVPIKDPTGSRTKVLNAQAVPSNEYFEHLNDLYSQIKYPTDFVDISDPRKIRATTGKAIVPTRDLVSGSYNKEVVENIVKYAKSSGVDPYTALAIGLQETGFGKTDANVGHVLFGDFGKKHPYDFINFYKEKEKEAKKAGVKDEAKIIQYYNGLGVVRPSTESGYHGFNMKSVYGVPIPKGGISMKKNPLYGKQIIDLRDNVLKENEEIVKLVEKSYATGGIHNISDISYLGDNGDDPKPKSRKQIQQEEDFTILDMMRGTAYKNFLDPETQKWIGEGNVFDFGKGPIKGTTEKGFVPITTDDFKTWRIGQATFDPDPEEFIDTGITGLNRDDFNTKFKREHPELEGDDYTSQLKSAWDEAYAKDHIALAVRHHKKFGDLYFPIGTGEESQKRAEGFVKTYGDTYMKGQNYLPYFTIKATGSGASAQRQAEKQQQAYYDWKQAKKEGLFESGELEPQEDGGVFKYEKGGIGEDINPIIGRAAQSLQGQYTSKAGLLNPYIGYGFGPTSGGLTAGVDYTLPIQTRDRKSSTVFTGGVYGGSEGVGGRAGISGNKWL
jgi:hypothetical protein